MQQFHILDMPREVLEQILCRLDDRDLLSASHVCTQFAVVAETAFELKYSNRDYCISAGAQSNEKSIHEVILTKYGDRIGSIKIDCSGNETLVDLIERRCLNLECAIFSNASKLPMLRNLRQLTLHGEHEWDRDHFIRFIDANRQLETLDIDNVAVDVIDVLDGRLNRLTYLKWYQDCDIDGELPPIQLPSLETLHLFCMEGMDSACILRAMNTNGNITKLIVVDCFDADVNLVSGIYAFTSVVELKLLNWEITERQIRLMGVLLPHLRELSFQLDDNGNGSEIKQKVETVLSSFPNLKTLTIKPGEDTFDEVFKCIRTATFFYDFHASVVQYDTEINIVNDSFEVMVSTSRERVFVSSDTEAIEVCWLNKLNEKVLRQVLKETNNTMTSKIKIANDEHTVDMATYVAHKNVKQLNYLKIKTNGSNADGASVSAIIRMI